VDSDGLAAFKSLPAFGQTRLEASTALIHAFKSNVKECCSDTHYYEQCSELFLALRSNAWSWG
jgi:hypothetical protein